VILGLDTSGAVGSAALLGDDPAAALVSSLGEGTAGGVALAPTVRDLLARASLAPADLHLVGVGVGPGSYTGVRVAVSFARALALASGVPVAGVGSLDALACRAPPGRTVVCARDARREALYLAVYRTGEEELETLVPPRLAPFAEVPGLLPPDALVLGDAAARFPELLSGERRTFAGPELADPSALDVAVLAARRVERSGPDEVHDLAPVYLRIPEAEERRRQGEP
jgi:tRNA threonylcarbamoyladenosine biosynthesis protein TsaB